MVSRYIEFPEYEIELAIVAALFHDIGKIRTLKVSASIHLLAT